MAIKIDFDNINEEIIYEAFGVDGNEAEALSDAYLELYELVGREAMLKLFKHFRGDKIDLIVQDDKSFYKEMEHFNMPAMSDGEDAYRPLVLQILKKHLTVGNLRDTDLENIIGIILISENDLRAAEGNENKIFTFSKLFQPYTCYQEIKKIIAQYWKLKAWAETYKTLFGLFFKVLDFSANKQGFAQDQSTDKTYIDTIDSNLEFYKRFSEDLKTLELKEFMPEEELHGLRQRYCDMLRESNRLETLRNCSDECTDCIFNIRKCVDKWIKEYLRELFKKLCFVDFFDSNLIQTFEDHCFSLIAAEKRNYIKK